MSTNFTVSLERLIKDFSMESVYLPAEPSTILISSSEVNRPGLFITGFYDYFDPDRIQIIGRMETAFLSDLSHDVLLERVSRMFSLKIPALVVTRGLEVFPEIIEAAKAKVDKINKININKRLSARAAVLSIRKTIYLPQPSRVMNLQRGASSQAAACGQRQ